MDGRALLRYVRVVTRKTKRADPGWVWMDALDAWVVGGSVMIRTDTDTGYGYSQFTMLLHVTATVLQFWYNTPVGREGGRRAIILIFICICNSSSVDFTSLFVQSAWCMRKRMNALESGTRHCMVPTADPGWSSGQ